MSEAPAAAPADRIQELARLMKPALEAALDPIAVTNSALHMVYVNPAMRAMLKLRPSDAATKPRFCDHIELAACKPKCKVEEALATGKAIRMDEQAAIHGDRKIRLVFRAVPVFDPQGPEGSPAIGVILSVRDSTPEVLVQAKFRKTLLIIEQKENTILELQTKIRTLQEQLARIR